MRGPCERGRILFSRLSMVIQGEFAIGKFEGTINIDVDIEMISINKNNGAMGIVIVATTHVYGSMMITIIGSTYVCIRTYVGKKFTFLFKGKFGETLRSC